MSANTTETHGAIILRDGLPIHQSHNPEAWIQRNKDALAPGDYSIERRPAVVKGWMAFLLIAGRRGCYGIDGYVVRSIVALQGVTGLQSDAFGTQDYIASEHVIAPTLGALVRALDFVTGDLALIRGELSRWAELIAARYGIAEIP